MEAKVETAQLDPERLRFITRSVQNKQGLVWVACGVGFCAFDLVGVVAIPWYLAPLWIASVVLCLIGYFHIPKYYRRRFGWIKPSDGNMSGKAFGILLLGLLVLIIFGRKIGLFADALVADASNQIHIWFSDPAHHLNLAPVSLWLLYLCLHLWGRLRHPNQGDPNFGYFLGAGTLAWAFVAFYPLQHPEVVRLLSWRILNTCWFGLTFIAWGLYEHLMLVHLLPKRIHEDDDNDNE